MARLSAAAWVVLLSGVGCGYRFVSGSQLPEGVKSVCAPVFLNETPEPALETLFTRQFRQELMRAGTLGDLRCEARVEGTLLGVGSAPTIGAPNGTLASYRTTAAVRLRLVKDGRVLRETVVTGTEDYLPGSGDVLEAEANRQSSFYRLAETMMRDGYERLATGL
ncbi:LPS assembly lipoprotein LptE [Myxococcaceae bacterium GXIMD 01537]